MAPPSWYSRWDGSQRLDDLDADQLLEAMSDDILSEPATRTGPTCPAFKTC
jgi:hypothetical protein